jgi:hypothetical protein
LWVVPCQGIHTVGLRFPIDVVYLDSDQRVIHIIENLSPFRISPLRRRSSSVLELPTRAVFLSSTQLGDKFLICSPEEMASHWGSPLAQQPALPASEQDDGSAGAGRGMAGTWAAKLRQRLKDRRKDPRKSNPEVHAYYWDGGVPAPHSVVNISESGAYSKGGAWYPGTIIEVTLQRSAGGANGSPDPQSSLRIPCQVVRCGPDGIGLRFLHHAPQDRTRVRKFLEAVKGEER